MAPHEHSRLRRLSLGFLFPATSLLLVAVGRVVVVIVVAAPAAALQLVEHRPQQACLRLRKGLLRPPEGLRARLAGVDDQHGAVDLSGEPGLIPGVDMRDVGPGGAAAIMQAIHDAGLDQNGGDTGIPGDLGVTVFTVEIDGDEFVTRVAASGPGHPGGGDSPALALLGRLLDPAETWQASNPTSATYQPVAYRVYVAPAAVAGPGSLDWPLATAPADFGSPATPDFGVTGLRSGIVTGAAAPAFAAAVAAATSQVTFNSGGDAYQLWVRPLLPDELG